MRYGTLETRTVQSKGSFYEALITTTIYYAISVGDILLDYFVGHKLHVFSFSTKGKV